MRGQGPFVGRGVQVLQKPHGGIIAPPRDARHVPASLPSPTVSGQGLFHLTGGGQDGQQQVSAPRFRRVEHGERRLQALAFQSGDRPGARPHPVRLSATEPHLVLPFPNRADHGHVRTGVDVDVDQLPQSGPSGLPGGNPTPICRGSGHPRRRSDGCNAGAALGPWGRGRASGQHDDLLSIRAEHHFIPGSGSPIDQLQRGRPLRGATPEAGEHQDRQSGPQPGNPGVLHHGVSESELCPSRWAWTWRHCCSASQAASYQPWPNLRTSESLQKRRTLMSKPAPHFRAPSQIGQRW